MPSLQIAIGLVSHVVISLIIIPSWLSLHIHKTKLKQNNKGFPLYQFNTGNIVFYCIAEHNID